MPYYRQELVDLSKDNEETDICVKIASFSLVPSGRSEFIENKIDDSTFEGRENLKKLLKRGDRVKSIDGVDDSTPEGMVYIKKKIKELFKKA